MIKTEYVENGERIRHYSDAGVMIRQIETGVLYNDAVDALPLRYTYVETSEPILEDEPEKTELEELQEYYARTQAVLPEETK